MIRLLADEDFNNDLVRALRRRQPGGDLVRVRDGGLSGQPDPAVPVWAEEEGRILLTHNVATLVSHALARLGAGAPAAGVLVAPQAAPAGAVIDDLELIAEVSTADDWAARDLPAAALTRTARGQLGKAVGVCRGSALHGCRV